MVVVVDFWVCCWWWWSLVDVMDEGFAVGGGGARFRCSWV